MKLHELANKLGFKSPELLNKAKELGLSANGIGSKLTEQEEFILTQAFEGKEPTKVEKVEKVDLETIPLDLKKGAFIGIVFDGHKFLLVSSLMSLDQVKRFETKVISEHNTVFGAMIELVNATPRVINPSTIKTFKEEK